MGNLKTILTGLLTISFGLLLGNLLTDKVLTWVQPKYQTIQVLPKKERPAFKVTSDDYLPNEYSPPVVLLVEPDDTSNPNGTHCSGTVISNEYVITAAHCLVDEDGNMRKTIKIKNALPGHNGLDSIQTAIPVGINKRADYGLVKGNFSLFSKTIIDVTMSTITNPPGAISICGNGWGAPFTCYPVFTARICGINICFQGSIIFPAMSGGPVVASSPYGPILFAVNRGYNDMEVIVNPLVGLFESLGIEVIK